MLVLEYTDLLIIVGIIILSEVYFPVDHFEDSAFCFSCFSADMKLVNAVVSEHSVVAQSQ